MADVTFGVKVPEEMKNELSEIMKNTHLTGKEFMNMLLVAYKLEQNKEKNIFLNQDIDELQRLLQRVQNLYLNISERAALVIEESVKDKDEEIGIKEKVIRALEEKINTLVQAVEEKDKKLQEVEKLLHKKDDDEKQLCAELEEQKEQMKEGRILSQKYVEEITLLKQKNEALERFEIEINEKNETCERLKQRSDTLASDLWFAQREIEKMVDEKEKSNLHFKEESSRMEENYKLQIENQILQQKITFTSQLENLREENFKLKAHYTEEIHTYVDKIKTLEEEKEKKVETKAY